MDKHISAPISDEDAKELRAGDYVYITGTIYTARDAAHKRMAEALAAGEPLPIDMKNNIIYTDESLAVDSKNTFKDKIIKFVNKHAEIWKFIKFTFTGASTSVLELAVFWVLQYVVFKSLNEVPVTDNAVLSFLGIEYKGYMYSYFISAVIGYAAAYIMNRKLTFKADANPILSTVLYTIMVICTITFNTWFGSFLGTLIKNSGHDSVFIVLLTKLIVMTVPTLWTYPLNRFVIHRKKKA